MSNGSKPKWLLFLESTGGTALITVAIGGLAAQGITWLIQHRTAQREFAQTWLKARGDQALQGHTAYLQEQRLALETAYTLVGKMAAASDNLITITDPAFDHPTSNDRKDMVRYRSEFNTAEDNWREAEEKLSFQLSYYSDGDASVGSAWKSVRDAVDSYRECASRWHDGSPALRKERLRRERQRLAKRDTLPWFEVDKICSVQREALTQRMAQLGHNLDEKRTYVWRGWEDPDRLREALREK